MVMNTMRTRVYLLGCPAVVSDDDGNYAGEPRQVSLIGLFDVIEFCEYEPSAYVWSNCVLLGHVSDGPDEQRTFTVDEYDFIEQVHPKQFARMMAEERELALHED